MTTPNGYTVGDFINFLIELEEKNPHLDVDSMELFLATQGDFGSGYVHMIYADDENFVILREGVEEDDE